MSESNFQGKQGVSIMRWFTTVSLAVIARSLVAIVVLLLRGSSNPGASAGGSGGDSSSPSKTSGKDKESTPPPAVKGGQTVTRKEVPNPPPPPPMIGKPDRIRDVLLQGRTYEVTVRFLLQGPVRDKDWGLERIVNLNYLAEVQFTRRIDHNDGRRIEEFRRIKYSRMLKAESTAEFRIVWSEPGMVLLRVLDLGVTGGEVSLSMA